MSDAMVDEFEDEDDFDRHGFFAIKWVADGSESLGAAAACLRQWADLFDRLASDHHLVRTVDNGHVVVERDDGEPFRE